MKSRTLVAILPLILLVACSREGTPPPALPAGGGARLTDPDVLARGAQLFRENCAACHGAEAEGAPDWHRPGPEGKYPAPPLNGTAHDWHHPQAALMKTIREGTVRLGGNMPAWGGKLSDSEIEAVIAAFQARWPKEIYASWRALDEKARTGR